MMQTTSSTSGFKCILLRILSCVMVLVLTVLALSGLSKITQRKKDVNRYAAFFDHPGDMDVLFMGSSHMLNATFPMDLWHDYGITSYNFGGHDNYLPATYWVMENALDYADPEVVVIDCLRLECMEKMSENQEYLHHSFDPFPFSLTKARAVTDLFRDPYTEFDGIEDRLEGYTGILFPYSVYHERWNEIDEIDFTTLPSFEYGAESSVVVSEALPTIPNDGARLTGETTGIRYLKRMIEDCRKRGIEVLLVVMPFPVTDENAWISVNTAQDIADEYGVDFINFLDMDIVDFSTDCYDMDSHMNPSGAWKITDYLGTWLKDRYGLTDHRGDEAYAAWDSDYGLYHEFKAIRLGETDDLNTYLMLLADRNYEYEMSIGDARIFEDPTTLDLLYNTGVDETVGAGTRFISTHGGNVTVSDSPDVPVTDGIIEILVYEPARGDELIDTARFAIPEGCPVINRFVVENGNVILYSSAQRLE
ncbi:hypothetical protein SAMN02910292_00824 [Lachnospiraceae bacterium XBB2008]|nr:hypothetical protein SAMN02910292_00824 [Lachnospiraceae bacterium XBB2008]